MFPNEWAATDWLLPASIMVLVGLALILWTYTRAGNGSSSLRFGLSLVKLAAFVLLGICLLEPVHRYSRPEKGANLMIVMADDSQSLQIKDAGETETREEQLKRALQSDSTWMRQIEEDFDVRRYQFDRRLRPVTNFAGYAADQRGSDILSALETVGRRFRDRPSAGVILLTDGNMGEAAATRLANLDAEGMPPVYPVVIGSQRRAKDINITRVISSQTNFESAPVTITAELETTGYQGQRINVQLLDEQGIELEKKEISGVEDGRPFAVRFTSKIPHRGVNVFKVRAYAATEAKQNETPEQSNEATLVNNERLVIVDRGRGPYRILYVTGRPNWELKFLRRSLVTDDELGLVALVRIAKKEAKFTFRGRDGQESNSLFRGFESQDDDTAEQHDEPVFLRLGTKDSQELKEGFPKDAEALFEYDAVVLDDIEAGFFTEDQKSLLQKFVSIRGGGFLMLGGQESFVNGKYDKTQIGEMLPVYLDRSTPVNNTQFQLALTREGWLQPWVRIESTENQEQKRLDEMPKFQTFNVSDAIKPGATVLATVQAQTGQTEHPALVVQPFGKGRTAALMIGDFWRWHMKSDEDNGDLLKAWRQMMRWLVADVPRRVEVAAVDGKGGTQNLDLEIDVRDESFQAFDNASVAVEVKTPSGKTVDLTAEPSDQTPGSYETGFVSSETGAYRATVSVTAEDGSEIEQRETGWVSEPDRDEFASLVPNQEVLEQIAEKTGGEVIALDQLDSFSKSFDNREVPITETKTLPWWHRWTVFSIAIGLLVCEWGVRRWKGLP